MTEVLLEVFLIPRDEEDLFETLRDAGYEPRIGEQREVRFGSQAAALELVLRVVEDIAPGAALLVLGIAANWAQKRLKARASGRAARVRVLYGPDGEVAREVTIDEDDEP